MTAFLSFLLAVIVGGENPHDLHASYGNLGVEGATAVLQLRIFQNDLEEALGRAGGGEALRMEATPDMDALFLRYFTANFILEVDGVPLQGRILGSGADDLDRESVWWYQVAYDAPAPIQEARITNTLLFELFDDQSNVLRAARFPDGNRKAYYFAAGEETVEVKF
jgi:hypothetical protein